jgi:hypothetical protein
MLNMFYQRMCWRTNIQEEIVGILLMGIALPHVVSVQARKIDFQHYTCNVVSFSCSISWGQRWLFALLITLNALKMLTSVTVSDQQTLPSQKLRTLFIITLHIFNHFARIFNLHEVYWLYLTLVTWISLLKFWSLTVTEVNIFKAFKGVLFLTTCTHFAFVGSMKILAKWLKICRVMIKRVLIFLEGIVCKHLLVWSLLLSIYLHFLKYIPEK